MRITTTEQIRDRDRDEDIYREGPSSNVASVHPSLPGTEGTRELRALESCGLSQTRTDVTRERTATLRNGTCTHLHTDDTLYLHADDAL